MRSSRVALAVAMMSSAAVVFLAPSSLRSGAEVVGVAEPLAAQGAAPARGGGSPEEGFTDTPMVPGQPYHVHDPGRPRPVVITPAAQVGQPPSDAVVLFDGKESCPGGRPCSSGRRPTHRVRRLRPGRSRTATSRW